MIRSLKLHLKMKRQPCLKWSCPALTDHKAPSSTSWPGISVSSPPGLGFFCDGGFQAGHRPKTFFNSHKWHLVSRGQDAVEHPTRHRTGPTVKSCPIQNVTVMRFENPCLRGLSYTSPTNVLESTGQHPVLWEECRIHIWKWLHVFCPQMQKCLLNACQYILKLWTNSFYMLFFTKGDHW